MSWPVTLITPRGNIMTTPNVTFTSYSKAATSQDVYNAYNSVYQNSSTFSGLMNQISPQVNVVVVDGDSPQFAAFQRAAQAGYDNLNANNQGSGLQTPPPNDYAFTF